MKPILEIENLSIDFIQYERGLRRRSLPVIRDLSLTVEAGQVVAVVGASGSGKSLLAHAILDILPYNSRREGIIRYDGEELTDCIQEWLDKHTINSVYNLSDGSESFLQFEQVRIPLFDEKGKAQDARDFATELRKYLQKSPFHITSKVMVRGLGEAIIVLGEK